MGIIVSLFLKQGIFLKITLEYLVYFAEDSLILISAHAPKDVGKRLTKLLKREIQREREGLSSYIHSVGINQAISELENGSKKLLNQFPLLKDYRDKIWNTVIEELKPDENQQ